MLNTALVVSKRHPTINPAFLQEKVQLSAVRRIYLLAAVGPPTKA